MNKIDPQFPRFGNPGYRTQKGVVLITIIAAVIILSALGAGFFLVIKG